MTEIDDENLRDFIHEKTKILPGCHAKLKVSSDDKTVYCIVCKYWTKLWPIKRRDSIFWD